MPGYFNTSNADDGGTASTTSSAHVGFFGSHKGTKEPAPGTPGGAGILGVTTAPRAAGIYGENNTTEEIDGRLYGVGVQGIGPAAGVAGYSEHGNGVKGVTTKSSKEAAVLGIHEAVMEGFLPPDQGCGVMGLTTSPFAAGVYGANTADFAGSGVFGVGAEAGVQGFSARGAGVLSKTESGKGVATFSENDVGLFSQGATFAAVFQGAVVVNRGPDPTDKEIQPSNINGSIVIREGNLHVNTGSIFVNSGDIILGNGDCAEDFDLGIHARAEPGSVMVFDEDAAVLECECAYDKKVVGVVAGAGSYKPGLVLDRRVGALDRVALSMLGKVFCKVDATYGAIEVGDMLTTSPTRGHAMKAVDHNRAFGAVIGKAMASLAHGTALIPVLIALQ